jgi:hypothetical protein
VGDTLLFPHKAKAKAMAPKRIHGHLKVGRGQGLRVSLCQGMRGVMGSMRTPVLPSGTLQNCHPELVICSLSYSVAPSRPHATEGQEPGVISWCFHVRGSLEIHGETFFFLLVTLPINSYLQLTAKIGEFAKRGSQALGWMGHVRQN